MRALIVGLLAVLSHIAYGAASLQNFTVTSSQGSNALFVDVGATQSRPSGAGYNWPVTINQPLLASQPATVLVNFPDRSTATLTRTHSRLRTPDRVMWSGYGDGCSGVFSSWASGFVGTISCLNANYGVAVASGYQLTRYDSVPGAMETAWEPPQPKFKGSPIAPQTPSNPTQVDTTIDIMVLYTDAVRLHFDPNGGKSSTVAHIQHYVDVLQQALDASSPASQPICGPPTTPSIAEVNLVATKNVTRAENGDDFEADLTWMSDTTQEAYALRQFWRADVMMYLTEDTGSTYGQSRQPQANGYPSPGSAFMRYANSVLMRSHALNDDTGGLTNQPFVFMHEFAHTIGADHDHGNAVNTTNPVENWSFGHFATGTDGTGARTIMSYYVSGCGSSSATCPRVLHYSNAWVCDDWFRTGVKDQQENARTIADYGIAYSAQYQLSLGRIFYDGFDP